ncbi:lytic transglycosylase [Streptomyces sp. NPDC057910]|uniref:lytic transglycosylase n=1 Tax=Streptomyces sp. NPDC057910 TaxID=3346278 RepID=UPI0036EB4CDF
MVALSASEGKELVHASTPRARAASAVPPAPGVPASGDSPYYTELPPLISSAPPNTPAASATGDQQGIPATVLDAYRKAEAGLAEDRPNCRLPWQLLAGIGKVESGHANGGRVDASGTTLTPILGPMLDGAGFANIPDTDGGAYDGDTAHDRAVGPMQFIPSTWATSGRDGNADGVKNPNNIYDAALAAGFYLCGNGRDLAVKADLDRAILSYNRSTEYLTTVTTWFDFYRRGTHEVPDGTGTLPSRCCNQTSPRPQHTPKAPPGRKPSPAGPTVAPPRPGGGTPLPAPTVPRAATLEGVDAKELTAFAGGAFDGQPTARVEDASSKAMARMPVQFEIVGDTDTRFGGDATSATVATAADGAAAAPPLQAGEKPGTFTVRATVIGASLPAVEWQATVIARQADAPDGALTAETAADRPAEDRDPPAAAALEEPRPERARGSRTD